MSQKVPKLAGLSEEGVLDLLLAHVRRVALEDGLAERIRRRGYGRFTVDLLVRDWEVVGDDVGSGRDGVSSRASGRGGTG